MVNQETHSTQEIPLLVVGCNFRIASSRLREKLVTTEEDRLYLYKAIVKLDPSAGLLVLETCNRLEWVVSTLYPDFVSRMLEAWILNQWQESFPLEEVFPSPYIYTCKEAVEHILRVAVGMESLAVGEAQIAGQFQMALKRSQKEQTSSTVINRLGHIAGRIARVGYKIGFRSNYRCGVHGLVVKYLESHFHTNSTDSGSDGGLLGDKTIVVVGMGDIGRRTAALIEETFGCSVVRFNRTVVSGRVGQWKELKELPKYWGSVDVLVIATGAAEPVLNESFLGEVNCPEGLLVMDIGIPSQVSMGLRSGGQLVYRNIDHLLELGDSEKSGECIDRLESEVSKELFQFRQFCRGRELSSLLSSIHSGRLELTQNRIPDFVATYLDDLDRGRRKKIETAMKQFVKDYSNDIFTAFHDTMDQYWSTENQ